jgi:hypothetical protein
LGFVAPEVPGSQAEFSQLELAKNIKAQLCVFFPILALAKQAVGLNTPS